VTRRRTRCRFLGAAFVAATVLYSALVPMPAGPTDAKSEASPGHLRIATWNMCGVRQWGCQDTGTQRGKVDVLKELATADGAGAIMLQEVCTGDLEKARGELGPSWHSTFRAYTYRDGEGRHTAVRCAGSGRGTAGFAVLAASPLSRTARVPTRQPAVGLQRGILCAFLDSYRIRVCNAHLSVVGADHAHPEWEYRDDQLDALVGAVDSRTVFGGDLNGSPPTAANNTYRWIWPVGLYSRYRECDQSTADSREGRATHRSGVKLDYQFTRLDRTGCDLRETGVSDHRALLMTVRTG
jgi:endonuclease/exonuclease/phosphatase family metal-dependent hydrolase